MKKLDRLIIRTFFPPFVLTFFIALFVLLMQFLWKYVDDLIGKGLEWYIVSELLFYASASMVPMALPLAMLLSSIMTYGNLGEHYELFAVKSTGTSILRAMKPMLVTALVISGLAFLFANYYLPYANLKFGTLLFDIRKKRPALNISEGVFYNKIEGYSLRVGEKGPDNRSIKDVMIYDHTESTENNNVLLADSGEMLLTENKKYLILKLYDGVQYQEMKEENRKQPKYAMTRTEFGMWEKYFDLSEFKLDRTDESLFRDHERMLNLSQLNAGIDTLYMKIESRKQKLDKRLDQFFHFEKKEWKGLQWHPPPDSVPTPFLSQFTIPQQLRILRNTDKSMHGAKQQIKFTKKAIENRHLSIRQHKIEWHRKFTWTVACFLLFLIGAPFGAVIQRGGLGLPLVITVGLFIVYHLITITGEKLAEEGAVSPAFGMWLSTIIYLPFGIFLTYKVNVDSRLFNFELYYKFFNTLKSNIRNLFRSKAE